jgi:hypothetical protein
MGAKAGKAGKGAKAGKAGMGAKAGKAGMGAKAGKAGLRLVSQGPNPASRDHGVSRRSRHSRHVSHGSLRAGSRVS